MLVYKNMRKEIIQAIIKPYMKSKKFKNKGILFTKDMGLFQIEVEIQSQRYYKEENTENFRINYSLFCREFTELSNRKLGFAGGSIQEESTWIEINSQTDIERLKRWLLYELNSMMDKIENKYSSEYLLECWKKYNTDLQYPFLLLKNNPERLDEWTSEMKFEIQKLDAKLLELSSEKTEQEKRNDCLDKEMKLDGIHMKINRLVSKKKKILETLDFIQLNANKVEKTT